MRLKSANFNDVGTLLSGEFSAEWTEIETAIRGLPLCMKLSQQEGKEEELVFDPIATNRLITDALVGLGWAKVRIPKKQACYGKGIDFGKRSVLVEVQLSNYPFLTNNVVRADVLRRSKTSLAGGVPDAIVIITKVGKLPSQNSSLYFEQACDQMKLAEDVRLFEIPIRIVGLSEDAATRVHGKRTEYGGRTSRKVKKQQDVEFEVQAGKKALSPYVIEVAAP